LSHYRKFDRSTLVDIEQKKRERLLLACEQMSEVAARMSSFDPAVREEAHRHYEQCPRIPGLFTAKLVEIAHVSTARACLRKSDKITAWETEFLGSVINLKMLTPKQRAALAAIAAQVLPC
jgi:hypothetical protein